MMATVRVWVIDHCLFPDTDCQPMKEHQTVEGRRVYVDRWICERCTKMAEAKERKTR